jgi:Chaperone of endosialidase
MNRLIQLTKATPLFTIASLLVCFGFAQQAQAQSNTKYGNGALVNVTTGIYNSAFGFDALYQETIGNYNTATGAAALLSNINGHRNTADGVNALRLNTSGTSNTAVGTNALYANTSGLSNTAIGDSALFANNAIGNTALGREALRGNTAGLLNTAVGLTALSQNGGGSYNTAVGANALAYNSTGAIAADNNTAVGDFALWLNTSGSANSALGHRALVNNDTGDNNVATGTVALYNNRSGGANTAVGAGALYSNDSGVANTAVGVLAGSAITTADRVICIGNGVGGANVSDSCYIGNIWNQSGGSQAVYVNSDGKLGFQVSSRRFKDEVKPMDELSEAIYRLKPVSFRYKTEIEPSRPLGFGLIAEDVEEVSPDLVMCDADGKPGSVRYDAVNAMLLNEFLKEHEKAERQTRKIDEQQATIAQLKKDFRMVSKQQQKEIQALTEQLKEQAARIEKVNAQVQLSNGFAQKGSE